MARTAEAIGRWRSGRLSCLEAAEVLGMSERHFRRLRDRYEALAQLERACPRAGKAGPVGAHCVVLARGARAHGAAVRHAARPSATGAACGGDHVDRGRQRFLAERFVPAHNARFAVAAAEPGSAFVPFAGDLAEILCVQAERVVGNDNCVRYGRLALQIPAQRHRHHFVKVKVRVHAYADGRLAVFHGPRCLARYAACGQLLEAPEAARHAA